MLFIAFSINTGEKKKRVWFVDDEREPTRNNAGDLSHGCSADVATLLVKHSSIKICKITGEIWISDVYGYGLYIKLDRIFLYGPH